MDDYPRALVEFQPRFSLGEVCVEYLMRIGGRRGLLVRAVVDGMFGGLIGCRFTVRIAVGKFPWRRGLCFRELGSCCRLGFGRCVAQ